MEMIRTDVRDALAWIAAIGTNSNVSDHALRSDPVQLPEHFK